MLYVINYQKENIGAINTGKDDKYPSLLLEAIINALDDSNNLEETLDDIVELVSKEGYTFEPVHTIIVENY